MSSIMVFLVFGVINAKNLVFRISNASILMLGCLKFLFLLNFWVG